MLDPQDAAGTTIDSSFVFTVFYLTTPSMVNTLSIFSLIYSSSVASLLSGYLPREGSRAARLTLRDEAMQCHVAHGELSHITGRVEAAVGRRPTRMALLESSDLSTLSARTYVSRRVVVAFRSSEIRNGRRTRGDAATLHTWSRIVAGQSRPAAD